MRKFIENEFLKVEIDTFGAEIKSVLSKNNYREYMWYGNPKFWGRTSPVLFPFVGSMRDKKYNWQGKEYPMGQHGFARDNEFEFASQTDDEIWFSFKSNIETLAKYPFEFELQIGYKLDKSRVRVNWKVINPGNETMYFSIGAHPAFLCPVHGDTKEGYKLYFEGVDKIVHHGNDVVSGLSLREEIELPLVDNRAVITEGFFDRCTYMIEGNQTKCVGIEDRAGKRIVDVEFDTPLFAVWSPEKKNAPFICIEPWYGRCDALDFEGDLSEREFTNKLDAGEVFEGTYSMNFYEI